MIDYWNQIPQHYPFVRLDEFQLMPNHLHGIIIIDKDEDDPVNVEVGIGVKYKNKFGPQSKNLSSILRGFKGAVKSFATTNGIKFAWQQRFHDSIIRNEDSMHRLRDYIKANPLN